MSDDVYKKIFGDVKTGREYSSENKFGSFYNPASLRSMMNKFRQMIYGGLAGQNLSKENADLIISVLEPHLKNLPPGHKLDYSTKTHIIEQFRHFQRTGQLSEADFVDAKKIISLF